MTLVWSVWIAEVFQVGGYDPAKLEVCVDVTVGMGMGVGVWVWVWGCEIRESCGVVCTCVCVCVCCTGVWEWVLLHRNVVRVLRDTQRLDCA